MGNGEGRRGRRPPDLFLPPSHAPPLPPLKLNRDFFSGKKGVWPERKCLIDSLPPLVFFTFKQIWVYTGSRRKRIFLFFPWTSHFPYLLLHLLRHAGGKKDKQSHISGKGAVVAGAFEFYAWKLENKVRNRTFENLSTSPYKVTTSRSASLNH